jgi:hypothetical protein
LVLTTDIQYGEERNQLQFVASFNSLFSIDLIIKINYFMSNKLLNHRLLSLVHFVKPSTIIKSNSNLAYEMKLLNDNKQFKKTIQLFDKQNKNKIETLSSFVITQALKACAHLKDLHYGKIIHNSLSSHMKEDSYISASLIHLYSKFQE